MRYTKELFVLILQLAVFYLFPLFSEPFGPMGMVYVIIFLTFMLSALLGLLSRNAIKYLYPLAIAILFIPSVFIYYNESALIHTVWYFVISSVGLLIPALLNLIGFLFRGLFVRR